MRSLLLPSLNRAALRESQTTTRFTCGFSRSCNQAANVPSSKASDKVPCRPWTNSRRVSALVSSMHSHNAVVHLDGQGGVVLAVLEGGPTMVRLTLARKIAAITLTLWKKGEDFDIHKLNTQAA